MTRALQLGPRGGATIATGAHGMFMFLDGTLLHPASSYAHVQEFWKQPDGVEETVALTVRRGAEGSRVSGAPEAFAR